VLLRSAAMRGAILEFWRGLTPLTRGLACFLLVNCLLLNLALRYSPWPHQQMTALSYTGAFFQRIAHDDSWRPMRTALTHLDRRPDEPLYGHVFFEKGEKFQYAPTSLLPLDALRQLPFAARLSNRTLNGLSWLAVLALAAVVARVLVLAFREELAPDRSSDTRERALLALLAVGATLTFYPLTRAYYGGQIQTWVDLLFAGLVWSWIARRQATSGVLAGMICVLKPTLALLALWALLRRQWRFLLGFGATAGVAGLISLWAYGLANHLEYLSVLSYISQHGESFHANQSLGGTLHRVLGNGPNLRWEPASFAPYNPAVHAATTIGGLLLVGAALLYRRRDAEGAPLPDLWIAALGATLAAPIVWEHHYGVTLPLFAASLPAFYARRARLLGALPLLALAYALISNNYRVLNRLAATPWNFLQSYVLFGGALLLVLLYRLRAAQTTRSAQP